jgi:hypothetical protein
VILNIVLKASYVIVHWRNLPMTAKEGQSRSSDVAVEQSLELVSFFKKASKNSLIFFFFHKAA